LAWYDNEWGFSNRMLDTGLTMANSTMKSNIGVAA
jgi:glyceraldehyde-3-phosphate dehydrogenase/erythrose-4-phosphate dehydrogenase